MGARPITFLSDYGYEDEYAGVCRAVIVRLAPDAPLIDLTHGIPPRDIRRGAVALADALPYAPEGVHLAVVDPGVGTERRAVAASVRDGDRVLVGPDNGLMWPAIESLGGADQVVDLAASPFRLEPVSATFHGRDLFAPVAARLAAGAGLGEAGQPLEPDSLHRLELPPARVERGRAITRVLYVDRFGNTTLSARAEELEGVELARGRRLAVEVGGESRHAVVAGTFGEVAEGGMLLYEDSSRRLTLAVNGASAAEAFGLHPDDEVALGPAV